MRQRIQVVLGLVGVVFVLTACQLWPESSPDDDESDPPDAPDARSAMVSWNQPVDVDTGDGFRGPWRMNESEFHYVDDPSVSFGAGDQLQVAWVDNEQRDVLFRRYETEGQQDFEEATNVSNSPDTFSWLPVVASSHVDDDTVYMLWQEIVFSGGSHGGEIYFSRSTDGGQSFERPRNLSETPAGAGKGRLTPEQWNNGSLELVVGPDDELFAAWTEYEGRLWFRRSIDGGETFEESIHVAGSEDEPARAPSVAFAPGGLLYLAWAVGERQGADIQLARSRDGGQSFRDIGAPVESPAHSDAPEIAVDEREVVHLVFGDSPDGPFEQYRVLHTFSTDRGASFEAPTEISGLGIDELEGANFPSLALGADGRVFVVWEHYPDYRERPMGLGFAASDDGGQSFEPASLIPASAEPSLGMSGGLQGLLMRKIDADRQGRVAVGHSTFLPNEESRVRLIPGQVRGE